VFGVGESLDDPTPLREAFELWEHVVRNCSREVRGEIVRL
jgi:hypothetical protein